MFIENAKVKKPEKTKIQTRNGINYVYEITESNYIKEKKYVVEKRKLIGKMIDNEYMIPNQSFYDFYGCENVEFTENSSEKGRTVHIGSTCVFNSIVKSLNLKKLLGEVFQDDEDNDDYVNKILDLSYHMLVEETAVSQHFDHYRKYHVTKAESLKNDVAITRFYQTLKASTKSMFFFKKWIQKNSSKGRVFISYDSTNFPNYSVGEGVTFNELGKAKIYEGIPQINLSYAVDQKTGTPLAEYVYEGSKTDVSQISDFLNRYKEYGVEGAYFVLDRGYFSRTNIEEIMKLSSGFLLASKISNTAVKEVIDEVSDKLNDINNYIFEDDCYGKTVIKKLFKEDLNGEERHVHIFWSEARFLNEKTVFLRKLTNFIEKVRENSHILEEENNNSLAEFVSVEFDSNGEVSYSINNDLFKEEVKYFGYFCLISSMELTAKDALKFYRNRDVVEKLFSIIKSHLGGDKVNVHTNESIQAKAFVTFIASIIRNEIFQRTNELRKTNKKDFTVPEIISQLDQIDCSIGLKNKYVMFDAPNAKQKKILSALKVNNSALLNEVDALND